jgi:two-component system, NarL family, sensor histidine kinase DevS
MERALDATAAAIVGVDARGRTLFWNRGAELMFGWQRDEVLGRVPPIVPPSLRQEWRLQMRQVLDGGRGTVTAETERLTRDGRLVPVLRSASPLHDQTNAVIGVLDTLVDISAHKQLDEESRALTQVRERELIAMDLHDGLIQSLYGVGLRLAALERGPDLDPQEARNAAQHVRHEIERIIEEARSYLFTLRSREFAPRDLGTGLRLLVDALRLNGQLEPELRLDPSVDERLDPEVRGHLLYITREATSNILRHAHAAHVLIEVAQAGDRAMLLVQDDGCGFEADARTKRGHYGLRNMASRARLIGGKLNVSTRISGGTEIRVEVPLRRR